MTITRSRLCVPDHHWQGTPPSHPQHTHTSTVLTNETQCQTEGRWNHGRLEFHLTLHTLPEAVHTARRTLHRRSSPPLTTNFTLDQIRTSPDLCHCTHCLEYSDGSCGPKDGLCHEASQPPLETKTLTLLAFTPPNPNLQIKAIQWRLYSDPNVPSRSLWETPLPLRLTGSHRPL